MAREDRDFFTATILAVTEADDGAGGTTRSESTAISGYTYQEFPMNAFTKKTVQENLGLQSDADLRQVSGVWNSLLTAQQILQESGGDKWRILSVNPQRSLSSTPDHVAMVMERVRK